MRENLIYIAAAIHLIAVLLFLNRRSTSAMLLLLLGGIVLRFYFVGLDPFIHDWDERFHALVARNLTHHWLTPTLIDHPILPYSLSWDSTHIWLHKQPLFLWQIALSIYFFGADEFAVRLPSLLMTSALIPIVYLIGKGLFDKNTAFIAAFIFSCYEPLLEMNSGVMSMDHNDIAFVCYVTLSICAWLYFERTGKRRYVLLMGFFSGCAILCKWLPGLLVFSGFAFYHFFLIRDCFTKSTIKNLCLAMFVCLLTFLPWQLYILSHFPVEAKYEYAYNSMHLYRVVEGHEHEAWFYFNNLAADYKYFHYLILTGMLCSLFFIRRFRLAFAVAMMSILIYIFFTIAETKLRSYVMVVAPLNIIFIAKSIEIVIDGILKSGRIRYILAPLCFAVLFYFFIDTDSITDYHFAEDNWQGATRRNKELRADMFRRITPYLPPDAVIVNLENRDNIDAMFYTGHTCYGAISRSEYDLIQKQNYPIVFWGNTIPDFAKSDRNIFLIKDFLK
jgi:4-amino-4-deoxy-L-arabinose transferase